MFKKSKVGFLSLVTILIISFCLAGFMTPLLKMIYPIKYSDEIEKYSQMYSLDKYFVMGMISAESGFDENAHSHKDAQGLMQLTQETASWCIDEFSLGIDKQDIGKAEQNIHIGCAYIDYLIERYDGNMLTAAAAYNAGPGNVDKWLSDTRYSEGKTTLKKIPFAETAEYVKKVQKRAKIYNKLYSD